MPARNLAPYLQRSVRLACAVLLLLSAGTGFAAPDLGTAGETPYDIYMEPVRSTLAHLNGSAVTLDEVKRAMRQGHAFRYSFETPYSANLPEVTAARRVGDCKDKALWLAGQLNDASIRFVIGKARANSKLSHAWLYWRDSSGRWWILDCTNESAPLAVDAISPTEYIPLYSYSKTGSFRHSGGILATVAAAPAQRVAGSP